MAGFLDEVLESLPVTSAMRKTLRSAIDRQTEPDPSAWHARSPVVQHFTCCLPLEELEDGNGAQGGIGRVGQISLVRIEDDVYAIGDICSPMRRCLFVGGLR